MTLAFIRDLFAPRNTSVSPDGWYLPVRATGDDNRYNAYEATTEPPPMELAGTFGILVPQSPGTGPGSFGQAAWDILTPFGSGVALSEDAGLLQTFDYVGGGPLYVSGDSNPQQELV